MKLTARIRRLLARHHADSNMLVLFLVAALGILIFLMLASEVREGEIFGIDRWLIQALRSPDDPAVPAGPFWLRRTLGDITALGGSPVLTLLTLISAGYLVAARKAATAAFLVAAISTGAIASTLLKLLFARARPDLVAHLVETYSTSFPSGHAMNSAITFLTLGALLARAEANRAVRIYLMSVAVFLTLIIGFSRVYLGVHWPSDVIAGWCVGAAWAMLCSWAARALQRRHRLEPESGG
ncbi:MAG: undecaprenyl-diphosphatase [Sphingomonadales bacterium]|jgi:undecaprenyl-diphosphatase|nr:undecaprenyl-diphosphatase [Sphingomonadales bacterium]